MTKRAAVVIGMMVGLIGGVAAQELEPVVIVTDAAWAQQFPDIAYNSVDNEFLVVWEQVDDSLNYDIYGRILDGTTGQPKGDVFPILVDDSVDLQAPETAYNPTDNQFVVICRVSSNNEVYGQLVANGEPTGTDFLIGRSSGPTFFDPAARARVVSICYKPAGNEWFVGMTPNESAAFLFLTSNGEPVIDLMENLGRGTNPATAWSTGSNVGILAYEDRRTRDTGSENLSCFLVDVDGYPLSEEPILLRDQANAEEAPQIAYNSDDDQFLVVWDERLSWADDSGGARATDTFGQIVGTDGTLIGEPIPVEGSTPYTLRQDVEYSPSAGVYLVVWKGDDNNSFAFADINGRIVNRDGSMPADKFLIYDAGDDDTSDPDNEQYYDESKLPVVAVNSEGRFFVVWEEAGTNRNPEERDIMGRFVNVESAIGSWELFR